MLQLEQVQKQTEQTRLQAQQAQQQAQQAQLEIAARRAESLIGQIRLCERFLKRDPVPEEQLKAMSLEQLQQLAEQFQREALGQNGAAGS